jgi:hypothetical protein
MKTRFLILFLIVALLAGSQIAGAATRPSIITFDSSLKMITVGGAEAGGTTTTLTWHTVGLTPEYRVRLHTYLLDRWESVFPADSVPLEADGSRVITVRHPLNFGPPTFLLSILHTPTNNVVDQRILTIAYDLSTITESPVIDTFETEVEGVEVAALQNKTAQVVVAWSVANRVPTSNLVFEQFADGSAVSVELPIIRVPSAAQGPVAPVYEEGHRRAAAPARHRCRDQCAAR